MIWIWPVGLIKFQLKIVGKQKMLVLSSMGQNRIPVEHQHWWGGFKQTSKQNPQRSATYLPFTDIYISVAFFPHSAFFSGKPGRWKVSAERATFTAPSHECCSQQLKFTLAKGNAFRWLQAAQAVPVPHTWHQLWESHLEVRVWTRFVYSANLSQNQLKLLETLDIPAAV